MIFGLMILGLLAITLTIMGVATLFHFKEMVYDNTNRVPVSSDASVKIR